MKMPPLSGLRAFEAAARMQNFRKAATELGMTPAAVSQHVRSLEAWLGVTLFERGARGVVLTPAGQEFGTAVTSGLGQIGRAAERIKGKSNRSTVKLACLPSVVSHWLAPRLDRFRSSHPEIAVSISYAGQARSPADVGADLLIQHGPRNEPGTHVILSAATRPTCAPSYVERKGQLSSIEALLGADLLHDDTPEAWQRWLAEGGFAAPAPAGPVFADFNLLLSSVTAGLGIGLCPTALISRELSENRLTVLFDRTSDTDKAYWLKQKDDLSAEAVLMRDWLIAEADDGRTG